MEYDRLASEASLQKTVKALTAHGFTVTVVEDGEAAKAKVLELIPKGSEVFNNSSTTLDTIGLSKDITEGGRYESVRTRLYTEKDPKKAKELRLRASNPPWSVGSVHAVTEEGEVAIASATGSQLPSYAYTAEHVVWVVGTQKIVPDMMGAFARIERHVFPLEDARALKAYGAHSSISKILICRKEPVPNRTHIILVKEKLGF